MKARGPAGAALVLAALNLRLTIAALPPVLDQVRHSTGLSSAGGGLLTAIPVFCFGACALATPRLIRRWGLGPLLGLVLVTIAAGAALRLLVPVVVLFLGTAVIGAAIAVGNALVPSLIKRDFADQRVLMTGLYSMALCIGGGLSAGLTVPIEQLTGLGWRGAVSLWGILALVALAVWTPFARRETAPVGAVVESADIRALWRDRIAWSVTLFMGLQSFGFYSTLTWIPTILENHGTSSATAGWLLSFSTIASFLAALLTPLLERRLRAPLLFVLLAVLLCGGGYVGLMLAPVGAPYAWMALLGLGQGVSLSLALGYIVARAPDGHVAAHLSTMAQSIGYMLAAGGPFLLGALHGLTGGWVLPMAVLIAVLVPFLAAGVFASRPGYVLEAGTVDAPPLTPAR